ncbi:thermonuclease family protein [Bradyrhizobium sp. 83012]|uniref:Thermonuclease family protein n=1 Tax=Bradyrhizobium aeschynomenes TaxID=2734909 RepID=A0ABX2CKN7_9BRAD|nr:thermonuclease family protein [Bradyrhizobium aeschynomenes]
MRGPARRRARFTQPHNRTNGLCYVRSRAASDSLRRHFNLFSADAILQSCLPRLACVALLLATAPPATARDLIGRVSIVDGDTLDIRGERIRLWGVDAPESAQLCRGRDRKFYRCGALAANTLDAFTRGKTARCAPVDADRYGRIVARCAAGGADLGQFLVSRGLAIEEPQYSHGAYAPDQLAARRGSRGIWSGRFIAPPLYRSCMHAGGTTSTCSDDPAPRR